MWTSNAGIAGLFTVFAKIDGEKFAAFLIEAGTAGLTVGPEEHKMGIRGSSTCPLVMTDCKVPIENLLGEAGQGPPHRIQYFECGTIQAGRGGDWRREIRLSYRRSLREGDASPFRNRFRPLGWCSR